MHTVRHRVKQCKVLASTPICTQPNHTRLANYLYPALHAALATIPV